VVIVPLRGVAPGCVFSAFPAILRVGLSGPANEKSRGRLSAGVGGTGQNAVSMGEADFSGEARPALQRGATSKGRGEILDGPHPPFLAGPPPARQRIVLTVKVGLQPFVGIEYQQIRPV
jgi:hypothetical protein